MYLAMLLLLMLVLPVVSVVLEAAVFGSADLPFLIGKWFVFWGVGLRLLLAGIKQAAQPSFTAEKIFGISDAKVLPLVQEIGFGNLAIGLLGIATILQPAWIAPAAVVGCVFFALAGFGHLGRSARNRKENVAMVSDLGLSLVLAVYLAMQFFRAAA